MMSRYMGSDLQSPKNRGRRAILLPYLLKNIAKSKALIGKPQGAVPARHTRAILTYWPPEKPATGTISIIPLPHEISLTTHYKSPNAARLSRSRTHSGFFCIASSNFPLLVASEAHSAAPIRRLSFALAQLEAHGAPACAYSRSARIWWSKSRCGGTSDTRWRAMDDAGVASHFLDSIGYLPPYLTSQMAVIRRSQFRNMHLWPFP